MISPVELGEKPVVGCFDARLGQVGRKDERDVVHFGATGKNRRIDPELGDEVRFRGPDTADERLVFLAGLRKALIDEVGLVE